MEGEGYHSEEVFSSLSIIGSNMANILAPTKIILQGFTRINMRIAEVRDTEDEQGILARESLK